MGKAWFIGGFFILLVVTITVAIFLSQLISLVKAVGTWLFGCTLFIYKGKGGPPSGGPGGAIPPANGADISPKSRPELQGDVGGGKHSMASAGSGNNVSGLSDLHSVQGTGQRLATEWGARVTRILGRRRRLQDSQQEVEYLEGEVGGKEAV